MSGQSNIVRLRRIVRIQGGGTPAGDDSKWADEVPFVTPPDLRPVHGGLCVSTDRSLSTIAATRGTTIAPKGTVMVSKRAPIGYVARLGIEAAFNQGCLALIPDSGTDSRFLTWVLSVRATEMESLGQGTTFQEISAGSLAGISIFHPETEDQRAIAEYLDRETAQIDELMSKQAALVETLRERRASLVSTNSTEALNGSPGLRLKHYVRRVRQGWSPQCHSWQVDSFEKWGVLKAGAANGGVFQPHENKELPDGIEPRPELTVTRGLLVVSRANTRELVGSAAVVKDNYPKLMLCDKLFAFDLDIAVADPNFVSYLLGSRRYRSLIEVNATGASHSMQNISLSSILNLPMPLPPIGEQRKIAAYLDEQTAKIDLLIEKANQFMELAKERRAALITAAVTGQIDVRGEAA